MKSLLVFVCGVKVSESLHLYLKTMIIFNGLFIFIFYVHWCFACIHVCVRVPDTLELELQTVVSSHVGARNMNSGPLEEQPLLLTTEPSLQPNILNFKYCLWQGLV